MTSLLKPILVAVVILPMLGSSAFAQRPFQRLQEGWDDIRPRGKILKELFGEKDKEEEKKESLAADKRRQEARRRQQQPAAQAWNRRGRQPTPAAASANPPKDRTAVSSKRHPVKLELSVAESKKPAGLIVRKAGKSGAAYQSGIRPGDLIVAIGGLEVKSKEDVENITSVLKSGDQIEFDLVRRGKKENVLVQLGNTPERQGVAQLAPSRRPGGNEAYFGDTPPQRPGGSNLQSVLDGNISPRAQSSSSRRNLAGSDNLRSRDRWQVQPPATGNRLPDPSRIPRAAVQGRPDPKMIELQRQLEAKQREIDALRKQLQNSGTPVKKDNGSEIDPLLDFQS